MTTKIPPIEQKLILEIHPDSDYANELIARAHEVIGVASFLFPHRCSSFLRSSSPHELPIVCT